MCVSGNNNEVYFLNYNNKNMYDKTQFAAAVHLLRPPNRSVRKTENNHELVENGRANDKGRGIY